MLQRPKPVADTRPRIRTGAVSYLNTKPLIEGLTRFSSDIELSLDYPSRLADLLGRGELEIGLIPVIEFLRGPGYRYLPGISIATRGPVLSVTLFSRVPWNEIRSVALDEGSRTSAGLTKILLAHRYQRQARFEPLGVDDAAESTTTDAVLLIGDRAMRACLPEHRFAYDLGAEWTSWTGLPMVFAVWAVRPGVVLPHPVVQAFHHAKAHGLANAGLLAAREAPPLGMDPGYVRRYFTNIIHYDLGPEELAGLNRYHALAVDLDLVPSGGMPHEYSHAVATESR